MRGRASRAALATLMGVAAAAGGVIAGGSPAWAHHQVTATYTATGGEQVWNVPAGVTNVHVVVIGARGGNGAGSGEDGRPGARVEADLTVPAGVTRLWVEVGERGGDGGDGAFPGFGGGGEGGAGSPFNGGAGGGASDLRTCSLGSACDSAASRLVVAGGGGGGGGGCFAASCAPSGDGGDGTAGGAGNGGLPFGPLGLVGFPGAYAVGGVGALAPGTTGGGGGGGGGGWYGGGGGSSGGAAPVPLIAGFDGGNGGSGASHTAAGAANVSIAETGDDASVTISYQVRDTTLSYLGATSGPVGAPANLRARLTYTAGGAPIPGATVQFTLAGTAGCSAVTDAAGEAACAVTPQAPAGGRALTASYAGDTTRHASSVSATYEVKRKPTTLTWTGDVTGDYHDPVRLAAKLTLTDTGAALPGEPVALALNATESCDAVTGDDGVASCTVVPQETPGPYTATAAYAGDEVHLPSSATAGFTVTKEQTRLAYTGDVNVANDEPARLSARLTEGSTPPLPGDGTPVAGAPVTLTLGSGPSAQSCTANTDAGGTVACVIADVAQPLDADGQVPVSAGYAGNSFYEPSQAAATVGLQYETGRAYALSGKLKVLVGTANLPATADTGAVRTADPSATATPCTATVNVLVLRAGALCANVTTRTAPGGSTATATVGSVDLGLPGLPAIALRDVRTTSVTDCAGSTGAVTVGQLLVGGVAVAVTTGPNSTVAIPGVPGAKIVFNEQVPVDGGLTVHGVHLVVPQTLGVSADLVFASATSDIHHCR
ncbi:Ig-like domain-containing protein [Catellatospora citrea]|uniref:Ig-like domain-containing protein n=1 Tax=Catellatospora citrea TaxID=53366 RepID=UPI0033E782C2